MPMINFQKIVKKLAQTQMNLDDDNGTWKRTDEQKEINGFKSRKYIYTNTEERTKMHIWATQDITIDISQNHLFGGQVMDFANISVAKSNENAPKGMMVRSVHFEKNRDTPSVQMDVTEFSNKSDQIYFDLSNYEVNDVLGKL